MLATQAGFGLKEPAWNDRALLARWRERWAEIVNERLAACGHDVRVDHRSYAAQGIDLEPQNKIGPAGMRRAQPAGDEQDENAERVAEHLAIARRNGEKILAAPEIALDALTRQQSTFTRRDLARLVDRHSADAAQFALVLAKLEASPELVRLGEDGRGQERFSTRAMLEVERRMEAAAVALSTRQTHRVSLELRQDAAGLGDEQRMALGHVTRARDLSVVVGYAGTGKSTMLGVARRAWEAEGYTVRGAALSGIAAEGLEGGAGIASRTVHSLLHAWDKGRDLLSARDVLVVDEAGMIGSRQMERLLSAAAAAGAKLVLVGDPEQLQAIEAGAAFRAIEERVGSVQITEVRRQRERWQQEATKELATGRTGIALERYEAAGMVRGHVDLHDAKTALVAGWDAARREQPEASQIILAYRRDDVRDLNERVRAVRSAAGELGADQLLATERGERMFAEGDRLYFLRNERRLAVKNGTLGTVERIEGSRLTVRLDGPAGTGRGRAVSFDLADYSDIDHGYAATVHKSQGVTVDRAHVLATGLMDRHAAYVGLTRHRDGVALHYARDEFADMAQLARGLGRERAKDTTLDYSLEAQVRQYGARRGLVPESEIVMPAARPSRFARLKLSGSPSKLIREPVTQSAPAEDPVLSHVLVQFAEAVLDARRMLRAQLPVLPHQQMAMEEGLATVSAVWLGVNRADVVSAIDAQPELIAPVAEGKAGGEKAMIAAIEDVRMQRLAKEAREVLETRARQAVERWTGLERQYDLSQWSYQHQAIDKAKAELMAYGAELKQDVALDRLLRERGQEFGIAAGSRLDRVVRHDGWTPALAQDLGLVRAPLRHSGPSPGMGM